MKHNASRFIPQCLHFRGSSAVKVRNIFETPKHIHKKLIIKGTDIEVSPLFNEQNHSFPQHLAGGPSLSAIFYSKPLVIHKLFVSLQRKRFNLTC